MKSLLDRSIFVAWVVIILIQLSAAQNVKSENKIFINDEWLRYKVQWGFIRLGSIEVIQKKLGSTVSSKFVVQIKVESAPLPFINLYCVNRSILNSVNPINEYFNLFLGEDQQKITAYVFDQVNQKIYMSATDHGRFVRSDTLNNINIAYDAGGIFVMLRMLSAYDTTVCLPTLSEFQLKNTNLIFTNKTKKLKVSAIDSSLSARYFEGIAHWVGTSWGGVSGPFNGWVSTDAAAIPMKIRLKIFLGSVILELEDYKRKDWPFAGSKNLFVKETHEEGIQ